jgi:hypothetical protein
LTGQSIPAPQPTAARRQFDVDADGTAVATFERSDLERVVRARD